MKNIIKAKMQQEAVLGVFQGFNSPNMVEVIGYAGLDFIVFDSEHGYMTPETMENMVRAAECSRLTPFIRVPQNERQYILKALDIGALGIHVPMVNTRDDAEKAVYHAKYYPRGGRGLAFSQRSTRYGVGVDKRKYLEESNRETMVMVHLETRQAIENLPRILEVEGVDVLFIGPTDLAQSLGYYGDPGHEEVQTMITEAMALIIETGKVPGVFIADSASASRWVNLGARYIAGGASGICAKAFLDFKDKFKQS